MFCIFKSFQLFCYLAIWHICTCSHMKWSPSEKRHTGYISPFTEALNVSRVSSNPVRLKKRRQLKQSQTEKSASEQNSTIISCPGHPNDVEPSEKTDPQRITSKPPAGSGGNCTTNSWRFGTTLKTLNTVQIAKKSKGKQYTHELNQLIQT